MPLIIITGTSNGPKAFLLFNWDTSLCIPSSLDGLSRSVFNEIYFREPLNGLLESATVFDRLGPMSIKKNWWMH